MIVYEGAANTKANVFGMKTVDGDAEDLLPQQQDRFPSHTSKHEASEPSGDKQLTAATGKRKVQMPRTLEREYWLTKKTSSSNTALNDNKLK